MLFHQLDEFAEQVIGIMRPRRGFRMVLHRKRRVNLVMQSFDRVVIEIDMGHEGIILQAVSIYCKAVIL